MTDVRIPDDLKKLYANVCQSVVQRTKVASLCSSDQSRFFAVSAGHIQKIIEGAWDCADCLKDAIERIAKAESRLSAHTEAAELALAVLQDELDVRMGSFCAKREDGTYDRSVCDQNELADLESCEAAIKVLTDAMGAPDA
jgi:hypothetical protein